MLLRLFDVVFDVFERFRNQEGGPKGIDLIPWLLIDDGLAYIFSEMT